MGIIRRLDTQTINKIAAGEVVESPASVIKELVENALDAGATEVSVEYLAGGLKLLRVTDNGCGMEEEDALLAFEQHATSKISTIEDVQEVVTKGFRGEALASIASVSKVTLVTAQEGQGTEVEIRGGILQHVAPAARNRGTTITIRDLFYNVPARRKFQKSPTASATELIKTMIKLMLASPNVHFTLLSQGKIQLEAKGNTLKDRSDEVLGKQFLQGGFPVSYSQDGLSVEGYVGSTTSCRANRAGQYLFVNGRAIQSNPISLAVKDGYGTRVDEKKHPVFILFVTVPGLAVDVNVHPQKKEVRFRDEREIKEGLRRAVAKSFFHKTSEYKIPNLQFDTPVFELQEPSFEWTVKPKDPHFFEEVEQIPIVGKYKHLLFLAAPFLNFDEGIVVLNLKKARRRVFFERAKHENNALQKLMTPEIFEETTTEAEAEALLTAGISARPFGAKETVVDAVWNHLKDVKEVFYAALEIVRKGAVLEAKREASLKLMALKHVRESWEQKTQAEALMLVRELLKTNEPQICPEGKPICKGFLLSELE